MSGIPIRQQETSATESKTSAREKKKFRLIQDDFLPRRFALSFNPPMIILEYMIKSKGKLYLKKMKLFKLRTTTGTEVALQYLRMRYPEFFDTGKMPEAQIIRLVDKLKDNLRQQAESKKKNYDEVVAKIESDRAATLAGHKRASSPVDSEDNIGLVKTNNFIKKDTPEGDNGKHAAYSDNSSEDDRRPPVGKAKHQTRAHDSEDFDDNFDEIEDFADDGEQ